MYAKLVFICTLALLSMTAKASFVWGWSINNPIVYANANEEVVASATIYNLSQTSTLENLDATDVLAQLGDGSFFVSDAINLSVGFEDENIFDEYELTFGPGNGVNFYSQFAGVEIAPGENFDFVLYTLSPLENSVNPGVYEFTINSINLLVNPENSIDAGGFSVIVIPLPSAIYLYAACLFLCANAKRLTRLSKHGLAYASPC